jgi:putative membrane protein
VALLGLGKYALFIRAQLWPLLLASLIILVLFLGAMMIAQAEGGRKILAQGWVRGLLLILPLLYLATLMSGSAASGLNSFALEKRELSADGSDMLAAAGVTDATPIDTHNVITLSDLYTHNKELVGKHVDVIGRVSRTDIMPANQLVLYRFMVVCCAADAIPLQITVDTPHADKLANDQWVRIGGTLGESSTDAGQTSVIHATDIHPIDAPPQPYLSPYSH